MCASTELFQQMQYHYATVILFQQHHCTALHFDRLQGARWQPTAHSNHKVWHLLHHRRRHAHTRLVSSWPRSHSLPVPSRHIKRLAAVVPREEPVAGEHLVRIHAHGAQEVQASPAPQRVHDLLHVCHAVFSILRRSSPRLIGVAQCQHRVCEHVQLLNPARHDVLCA